MKDVAHIVQAVKNFDAIHKSYREAGGTIQDEQEKKLDLLESVPKEIGQTVQWRMDLPYRHGEFRDMLTSTADAINYHDGAKSVGIHAIEPAAQSDATWQPCAPANDMEESILAFMKKMGFSGGGARGKGTGKGAKTGGDGPQTRRCVNCGSADHLSAACTKTQVYRDKRPCCM